MSKSEADIAHLKLSLDKRLDGDATASEVEDILNAMNDVAMTIDILRTTKVGKSVANVLKKYSKDTTTGSLAEEIVSKWKTAAVLDKKKEKNSEGVGIEKKTSKTVIKAEKAHGEAGSDKSEEQGEQKKSKSGKAHVEAEGDRSNPVHLFQKGAAIKTKIYDKLAPEPTRRPNGDFVFSDYPDFHPNLSPSEVLQMGSFGGTYFRPIYSATTKQSYGNEVWQELPPKWLEGLNIARQVRSSTYNISVNKYKVKSGGDLAMWEDSGWMRDCDPYGNFQWLCRFFRGRRCDDDERQIARSMACFGPTGRWRGNLCGKVLASVAADSSRRKTIESEVENFSISPVVRQTLQHWGYKLTAEHVYSFQKRRKQ
jgi:hypothetical protein